MITGVILAHFQPEFDVLLGAPIIIFSFVSFKLCTLYVYFLPSFLYTTLRFKLPSDRFATIISSYVPTLQADEALKDAFYHQLGKTISNTLRKDKLILLEGFNARGGADSVFVLEVLGKRRVGKMNEDRRMLLSLSLCTEHNLVITAFFRKKKKQTEDHIDTSEVQTLVSDRLHHYEEDPRWKPLQTKRKRESQKIKGRYHY